MRMGIGLIVCVLFLAGCSEPAPAEPSEPSEPSAAEPSDTAEDVEAPPTEPDAEDDGPPPLGEPLPLADAEVVRIESGGVTIVGDLRAVEGAPTAPLVVLVHQLSSQRAEWTPALRHLAAEPALATFALDMRGHGESTEARGGETLAWQSFEPSDWEAVEGDIRAVLDALLARLEPSRIILVGSSIGSSAVVRAAAADPRVHAVAALSPGRAYRGLDALTPLTELGPRPLLALASRGEQAAAETAHDMARIAPAGEYVLVDGDVHGVSMFEADPTSLAHLVAFVRAQAAVPPAELPEASAVAPTEAAPTGAAPTGAAPTGAADD